MVSGLRQLPYDKQLEHLRLWTLEALRNRADLLGVYRIYKGWSTTAFDNLFTLHNGACTRGHRAKLVKNRSRLELRRHFFSERVVNRWNSLDQWVIDSTSMNAFQERPRLLEKEIDRLLHGLNIRLAVGHMGHMKMRGRYFTKLNR